MGLLSEAYQNHPLANNSTVPLDFSSIKHIPESHTWVEEVPRINNNDDDNNNENSISVINLEDPEVVDKIFKACEKWGVFQITNHGISSQVLEKLESEIKRLFNLPMEEKMKVLRSPGGATGYGAPWTYPSSKLLWSEGFTMMGDSIVDHAKILWPNDFQVFCDVMEGYQAQTKALAEKLMGLILKSLNIPESDMNWANIDPKNISKALQLNSYPPCPDPTKTMGLGQHTDTFLLTILHQTGQASGLQVFKDGPGWVPVDPVPGALVVNVGDILHLISNGRFPSVVHRAVVNNVEQRISVGYFYGPPLDFNITPYVGYPGCEGPCFKSMKVNEYVSIKSKLLDSALSSVRL